MQKEKIKLLICMEFDCIMVYWEFIKSSLENVFIIIS